MVLQELLGLHLNFLRDQLVVQLDCSAVADLTRVTICIVLGTDVVTSEVNKKRNIHVKY